MLSTYAAFRGIEVHYTRSRRTYTWLTSNALSITLADLTAFLNNSFQFVILDQSALFRDLRLKMSTTEAVKEIWKAADAVCFDVDSTVCQDEGIDELARFCQKSDAVKKLTNEAMKGSMDFRTSLSMRLNIIQPSLGIVKQFLDSHPVKLTSGIEQLVSTLHQRKVPVYLISGGFQSLILPAAQKLNIPPENVFANRLKFYFNGEYAGFDEDQPTSRSGGKGVVIQLLKKSFGYQKLVLIGDGATDMEACPPADAFIGFGGNVVRAEVKRGANWFVTDFNELIQVIPS